MYFMVMINSLTYILANAGARLSKTQRCTAFSLAYIVSVLLLDMKLQCYEDKPTIIALYR